MIDVSNLLTFVEESLFDSIKRKYVINHDYLDFHITRNEILGAISFDYRDENNKDYIYSVGSFLGKAFEIPMVLFREEHNGDKHRYMINDKLLKEYQNEN